MNHNVFTRSDADGRFRLDALAPGGAYELAVRKAGHGRYARPLPRVAPADAPLDLGTIVLARAGRIRGRIVDERGTPLPGVDVTLSGGHNGTHGGLQRRSGRRTRHQHPPQPQQGRRPHTGATAATTRPAANWTQ